MVSKSLSFEFIKEFPEGIIAVKKHEGIESIKSTELYKRIDIEHLGITNPARRYHNINARYLAHYLAVEILNTEIKIVKSPTGRPVLQDSYFYISMSHNQELSAVMLSKNPCGIDIEYRREKVKLIQQKFLNESELLKYKDNLDQLTIIWSAKESVYKMINRPGLVFKEDIDCHVEQGKVLTKVVLKPQILNYEIPYTSIDNSILTYIDSGN